MKPKKRSSRKKSMAASVQVFQEYFRQMKKSAEQRSEQDPGVKKGYEAGQRMLREAELLQSGQEVSETELPLWVRELYRRLPFLQPGSIPEKPNIQGQQAGQALALALSIRAQYRAHPKRKDLTLEAGGCPSFHRHNRRFLHGCHGR
jgi:hypothetical protein